MMAIQRHFATKDKGERKVLLFVLLISLASSQILSQTPASTKPNVLMIMIDDLNDCIEGMSGHQQSISPHIKKLADSGAFFKQAYTNAPMCGPSRASLFTGIYPHHSRNFFQAPWFKNEVLNNSRTIMEQFKDAGYGVYGTGKIMHHNQEHLWTKFGNPADYGPSPFNGEERVPHPDVPAPFFDIGWVDGSLGPFVNLEGRKDQAGKALQWTTGNGNSIPYKEMRYRNDEDRDPTPDEVNANWAANMIRNFSENKSDQAFFLAVGFLRPHTPLLAPQKYFDRFPLDEIELATIKEGDSDDTHLKVAYKGDVFTLRFGREMHEAISKAYGGREMGLKKWTQAYLACVAAVDENVGTVMEALNNSPLKENTIVILASDHGFHMGEKAYLYKNSLWEESTRIPLIMRVPNMTKAGSRIEQSISLIDVYPTLIELCKLPNETKKNSKGHALDGRSLLPLLKNPRTTSWKNKPALTVVYAGPEYLNDPAKQHYALRSNRYRYILYNNGQEELYDHKKDPFEWANIAHKKKKRRKLFRQEIQAYFKENKLDALENLQLP